MNPRYREALDALYAGLNETQKKHLEAARWLRSERDEDRRTGRSHLLALLTLEKVLEEGAADCMDHLPIATTHKLLYARVHQLAALHPATASALKTSAFGGVGVHPRVQRQRRRCNACGEEEGAHSPAGKCLFGPGWLDCA